MPASPSVIDDLLSAALRGEPPVWPEGWGDDEWAAAIERIHYHGIAGLLVNTARTNEWPFPLRLAIRDEATARAMWDMRNHQTLDELFGKLAEREIRFVVLKGAALAYSAYASPDQRSRVDTDLLVDPIDVARTRDVLNGLGYSASWGEMPDLDLAFQEGWSLRHADGTSHQLDLHWQTINARSLRGLMPVADCLDHSVPLPNLSANARTLEPARLLLHTCLHRLMHRTSPYVVDNKPYLGGERLIWAMDIRKLGECLEGNEWEEFVDLAIAAKVAPVCLDALDYARRTVGVNVPANQRARLETCSVSSPASRYLLSLGRGQRLIRNLRAEGGMRSAMAFARSQLFPPASVLRVHYADGADRPIAQLLLRRWLGFVLPKRRRGTGA